MRKGYLQAVVDVPLDLDKRMTQCQKLLGLGTKNEFRLYAFLLACERAEKTERLKDDARKIRKRASELFG